MTLTARLLTTLLVVAPISAFAQASPPNVNHVGPAVSGGPAKEDAKPVPPPALPGAEPATEGVIPLDKTAGDMPPTEALFDSIHRGDVASARDALNRGADLEGHNVLGQSPLDLAIDLNRNDITFLLLSMRGAGTSERAPGIADATPPAALTPRTRRQSREPKLRPAQTDAAQLASASGPRPQLFAGDGGVPNPAVGFLGFGLR